MGNMSYCRFQNTEKDLSECRNVLEELCFGGGAPLSEEELNAANRLIDYCFEVVGLVTENSGKQPEDLLDSTKLRKETVKDLLKKINDNATV